MNTLASRYNQKALELMPHLINSLRVDPEINNSARIDEIVFDRGEYVGGMAAVILAIVKKD